MRHADVRVIGGEETPGEIHGLADAHPDVGDHARRLRRDAQATGGWFATTGHDRAVMLAGDAESPAEFAGTGTEIHVGLGLSYEKFAELIVRECIGIADEYDGVGSTIVGRIEKHFGVEE